MRKIFEFKVFDILQDKENVKFLDKVKKENPDVYTKFLNIIGNKGLDVAKEKYQEYDPEYRRKLEEEEKELKRHMRKIFEFKVFDILQDKENVKFLDKVKKENPDVYTKFLNIIGNKGLDVAKEKYQEYDPEYRRKLEEEEKELKRHIKKIGREKFKKEENELILQKYEPEINEIERNIYEFKLYNIDTYINKNENIYKYFNSVGVKMKYNNDFDKLLKNPANLDHSLYGNFHIDTILYVMNRFNVHNDRLAWLLKIHQYYNLKTKKLTYTVHFDTDVFDAYYTPDIDKDKNQIFVDDRNSIISNLGKSHPMDIEAVYDILDKYSNMLSDEYYNNWKIINDMSKFNL